MGGKLIAKSPQGYKNDRFFMCAHKYVGKCDFETVPYIESGQPRYLPFSSLIILFRTHSVPARCPAATKTIMGRRPLTKRSSAGLMGLVRLATVASVALLHAAESSEQVLFCFRFGI